MLWFLLVVVGPRSPLAAIHCLVCLLLASILNSSRGVLVRLPDFAHLAIALLCVSVHPAAGYMQTITQNPLPNTPAHEILLHHALGDEQVRVWVLFVGLACLRVTILLP